MTDSRHDLRDEACARQMGAGQRSGMTGSESRQPALASGIIVGFVCSLPLLWFAFQGLARAIAVAGAVSVALVAVSRLVHKVDWWCAAPTWFTGAWMIIFVGKPWFDLSRGDVTTWQGLFVGGTYATSVWLATGGLLFFNLGYYTFYSRHIVPRQYVPVSVSSSSLRRAALAFFLLVLCLTGLFLVQNSGFATLTAFLSGRSAATTAATQNSSGYLYTAPLWCMPVGLYLLFHVPTEASARKGLRRLGIAFLAFSMLLSIGTGDRSYFIPALLAIGIAQRLQARKPPRYAVLAILLPIAVFFLIIYPRVARTADLQTTHQSSISAALEQSLSPGAALFKGDDTAMAKGFALEIAGVPGELPYQYGKTYLNLLARPIPRQLFPGGKPQSGDALVGGVVQGSKTGIHAGFSYSFFAEPYLNWGVAGVLVFSYLFGVLWQVGWRALLSRADHLVAQLMWAISLPLMIVWVRGGLDVDFQREFLFTLPLFIVLKLATVLEPRRHAARAARADGLSPVGEGSAAVYRHSPVGAHDQ